MKKSSFIICLCAVPLYASINSLKGTYAILKAPYRDLSPIHGAVASETGALQTLYDIKDERKNSATVSLVKKLFFRTLTTPSDADFLVTKDIRRLDEDEKKTCFFVASILIFLRELEKKEAFVNYKNMIVLYKKTLAEGKKNLVVEGKQRGVKWVYDQAVAHTKVLIKDMQSSDDFKEYAEPFKMIVPYALKAHLECIVEGIFPAATTQLILLGHLYKHTGGDKRFLREYYELLDKRLSCLERPLDSIWQNAHFDMTKIDDLVAVLQAEPLVGERLQQYFEEYVFVRLARAVPLATYQDTTFQGETFADCMDTAVRNMVNALAYNPDSKRFDISLLEQRLGKKAAPSLKRFYAFNSDPSAVTDKAVHKSWAEIVSSNVPYVAYNRALGSGALPEGKRGFIHVEPTTDVLTTALTHKEYVPVATDEPVFTVKPSLKNAIVMLNHLFSLELFEPSLSKEFLRDDFVATYLPKLATALHATVPAIIDVDKRDFTDEMLVTPFEFNFTEPKPYVMSVVLKTENRHGVADFCSAQLTNAVMTMPEPLQEPYPLSLPLLVHGAEEKFCERT